LACELLGEAVGCGTGRPAYGEGPGGTDCMALSAGKGRNRVYTISPGVFQWGYEPNRPGPERVRKASGKETNRVGRGLEGGGRGIRSRGAGPNTGLAGGWTEYQAAGQRPPKLACRAWKKPIATLRFSYLPMPGWPTSPRQAGRHPFRHRASIFAQAGSCPAQCRFLPSAGSCPVPVPVLPSAGSCPAQ
jgi:hypothetical protein